MRNTKKHRRACLRRQEQKNEKATAELGRQLVETLLSCAGERRENQKHGEGAVECLERIIRERDAAMTKLALIAMHQNFVIY